MAEALKNVYSEQFVHKMLDSFQVVLPELERNTFLSEVFKAPWVQMELKERMSRLAVCMSLLLPKDFTKAAKILVSLTEQLRRDKHHVNGFEYMFLAEYIEKYGILHPRESLDAIEKITTFTSCEFAIRAFILKNQDEVMGRLLKWSKHPDEHVRRLASEGSRPRLPWAMALPAFKKDPKPILPILELLKNDPSLYVRRSVANNLNDISKDNPDLFIKIAKRWLGVHAQTDWIIKHASRSLLKAGNKEALELFNFKSEAKIIASHLSLKKSNIKLGEYLEFEYKLINKTKADALVRLEYGIYFLKKNGSKQRKVFKISERRMAAAEEMTVTKKHGIKPITTRVYYPGEQLLSIIVNGEEKIKTTFQLEV